MSRRDRIDPETARLVEERLQWLLTENGPEAPGSIEVPTRAEVGSRPAEVRSRPSGTAARAARDAGRSRSERRARAAAGGLDVDEGDLADLADVADVRDVGAPRADRRRREQLGRGDRPHRDEDELTVQADRDRARGIGDTRSASAVLAAVGSFRRPHLVIVGVIVALGILLAGWAVLRARPVAVAVTPPPVAAARADASGPSAAGGTPHSPAASPTAPPVVVHVLGAVKKPGLVELAVGSRVQDALDAAGGLTGKADPGELNLAQPVTDGQQIVVGTKGKPTSEVRNGSTGGGGGAGGSSARSGSGSGPAGTAGQPVDLNTASQAQLEELPGVGPVMAGKIIAWRTEHGRFSRVEELQEIDGVGPKTYAKLAPLCRV